MQNRGQHDDAEDDFLTGCTSGFRAACSGLQPIRCEHDHHVQATVPINSAFQKVPAEMVVASSAGSLPRSVWPCLCAGPVNDFTRWKAFGGKRGSWAPGST